MGRVKVEDLRLGKNIRSIFLIRRKRLIPFREREGSFLALVLGDKTGNVQAVLWEGAEEAHRRLSSGDMVLVAGGVREYSGALQINIDSLEIYDGEDFDPAEFLPVSSYSTEKMFKEIVSLAGLVENEYMAELLRLFFSDSGWVEAFKKAPAAKKNHQAYLGGLLEHTLQVSMAASKLAGVYPRADKDILIVGAILHDIGKICEYSYRTNIDFTDEGRLLGHILLGVQSVDEKISEIDGFPSTLRLKLLHIVASHHGRYEWQSPKRPKFLEAAIIHQLDLLDATVAVFTNACEDDITGEGNWTHWVKGLERFVFTG